MNATRDEIDALATAVDAVLREADVPMSAVEILDNLLDPDVTEDEVQQALVALTTEGAAKGVMTSGQPLRFRLTTREEKAANEAPRQQTSANPNTAKRVQAKGMPTQPLVFEWLKENGRGTAQQVADGTGLQRRQCENALWNLSKAGRIAAFEGPPGQSKSWQVRPAAEPPKRSAQKPASSEENKAMTPTKAPSEPLPIDAPRWAVWSDGSVELEVSAPGRVRLSADDARKLIDQLAVMTSRREDQAA